METRTKKFKNAGHLGTNNEKWKSEYQYLNQRMSERGRAGTAKRARARAFEGERARLSERGRERLRASGGG